MTIFDPARGKIIDGGGGAGGLLRLIGIGIAAFLLVILLFSSVAKVGTGHVGVLTLFGKVQTGDTLGEGIHLISPLKTNNELSIQTQTLKESASVPSSEGLMMSLDTSLIYHLNPDHAAEVFQKIGADYENVVVEPTLRSAIREATASHTANALYTGEREMVGKQIYDQVSAQLNQRGLTVENVLLRDIQLPATLKAAIEAKQQAEQESLAMNFRLQKETQEGAAQAHRGRRRPRLPADRRPGHQRAIPAGMERHRSHREPGQERQHQSRGHRQQQERPAPDPGTVGSEKYMLQ
jgi:regulator of protease activity HflC (stomatin/prohibitin superfamily)